MADETDTGPTREAERTGGDEGDYAGGNRRDVGGNYLDEGGYNPEHDRADPGTPLWDEGLIALLVVGGAVLVLVPEPATSAVGVLVLAAGLLAWLVDAIG